MKWKIMSRR